MPATPAWPPNTLPRLFVDQLLGEGATIMLDGPAANYLGTVLRLKPGAEVKLFDDRSGEWVAAVTAAERRHVTLVVGRHLRPREPVPDLWLLAAPIKRGRIDWMIEKACELGVARIVPVVTRRTIVDRLNEDRLRAHLIEATEQCNRTAVPQIAPLARLDDVLGGWPADRQLLFADETGGVAMADAVRPGPAAILIGPEGGFTPEERVRVRAVPGSAGITLGPRILRADTAMAAAVSLWMATTGDW